MYRSSLALKIVAYLVVSALAVTALAWAVSSFEESRIVHSEEVRSSTVLVKAIDTGLQAAMLSGHKDIARRMLDSLVTLEQIDRITIYDTDGNIWHESSALGMRMPTADQPTVVRVARTHRPKVGLVSIAGREVYRSLSPINAQRACHQCHPGKAVLGVTGVILSTAPIRTRLARDRQFLIASNLATVGFAIVVLGAALTLLVVRPIRRLADVARAIGEGDLTSRAHVWTADEIGQLGSAFNAMTDRLQEHIDDLEATRKELQETIERVGEAISSAHKLDDLIDVLAREAGKISKMEAATVMLFSDQEELMIRGARGVSADDVAEYNRRPLKRTDSVVVTQARRQVDREGFDPASDPDRAWLAVLPGAASQFAVPIAHEGRVLGLINLADASECRLGEASRRLLYALASQAGVAIQQIRLNEQAQVMAVTDGLTGLYNHRYFHERLATELQRSERFGHPLALIMLDVDHFKAYNDRYGHLAGDEVLEGLGALLREETRRVDIAARYGGEEFAIILVETDRAEAAKYAERLLRAVESSSIGGDRQGVAPVTTSAGVAAFPSDGSRPEDLVGAADIALYEAKEAGRNRVRSAKGRRA